MSELSQIPELSGDFEVTYGFFKWLFPDGPYHIETMQSVGEGPLRIQKFNKTELTELFKFIKHKNSSEIRQNTYFLPNAEFLKGKRNKKNISAARVIHVDLDWKDYPGTGEEQKKRSLGLLLDKNMRPKGIPMPSTVWMTGGGYQAIWLLNDPLSPDIAESLNKAVLTALEGGAGTNDISRLMRMPCSVNWLNDSKRKKGRQPEISTMVTPKNFDVPPVGYNLSDFTLAMPIEGQGNAKPKSTKLIIGLVPAKTKGTDVDLIAVKGSWRKTITHGVDPEGKKYQSRSERVFAVAVYLLGLGIDPCLVLAILLEPKYRISEHILEKANPLAYAQRQVSRALEYIKSNKVDWPRLTDKDSLPVRNHPDNIRHALQRLGFTARRNLFSAVDEYEGCGLEQRDINDIAEMFCSLFLREFSFHASAVSIKRELLTLAEENKYHPVLDYFSSLPKWDGIKRLNGWLADHCGAEPSELHSEYSSKTLIGAVRRIRRPGCKFDTMLVLEGNQGVNKSTLLRTLAIRDEWFCESLSLRSDDKTKAELLSGAWIVECQELDGLGKMASQDLKRFLSASTDKYRKPYDKNAQNYKRHCIIIGTTNEDDYLRDLTGNRRIWPVRVGRIDIVQFKENIDQIWAEALDREAKGESITLSEHLWEEAAEGQGQRMATDPYLAPLEAAFANKTGKVSLKSVKLLLGLPTHRMTSQDARRIRGIMEGLGWHEAKPRLLSVNRNERVPQAGFAAGSVEERKKEYYVSLEGYSEPKMKVINDSDQLGDKHNNF